ENPSVPLYDESLLADVPLQTVIVKARTLEPGYAVKRMVSANSSAGSSDGNGHTTGPQGLVDYAKSFVKRTLRSTANLLLQPDPQILWHHHAVEAGLRVLTQRKHDAIFVTAPPFSSLLVGAELSRRTGLPLVLDYRDEWGLSNAYLENKQHGAWSSWWQRRLQHHVVRAASALVATTRHSADTLAEIAAEANRGRCASNRPKLLVTHIYNGFDSADLHNGIAPRSDAVLRPPLNGRDVYELAYVGTLWNLTSVEPLVRAVQRLCQQSPELAARLELHFAGRRTGPQDELLNQLQGLPCRVVRSPYLDHDAALRLMQSADGLCLLLSDLPHAGRVVPAKLFEYLALCKPIIAIVPPGEASDLLCDCPLSFVHIPSDVAGLARRLGDEIERHRLGVPLLAGIWDANQYERRSLAGQLAELLQSVTRTRFGEPGGVSPRTTQHSGPGANAARLANLIAAPSR
ncbi:MAG TPA: glycosyltransferase, partial [Planctomycetaceae bacterium]|nr:glycosyltransferase [Planctomycetaceae bacterium]